MRKRGNIAGMPPEVNYLALAREFRENGNRNPGGSGYRLLNTG
jgi:hypothetical protein